MLPAIPVMLTASNANPLYRFTLRSRTRPVAEEIIIAPIYHTISARLENSSHRRLTSGDHPPSSTSSSISPDGCFPLIRRSAINLNAHQIPPVAPHMPRTTMNGTGVSIVCTNAEPTSAMMNSVSRSPSVAASGDAMLSGSKPSQRQPMTRWAMKLPSTKLLRQAATIPVPTTRVNSFPPGGVYPSL